MKVNVPIWSKVILGYTETVTGSCRGGLPVYEKCRPLWLPTKKIVSWNGLQWL